MNCFKCGAENADTEKYCTSCNALLPQQAPTGLPSTGMDLSEAAVDYPVPDFNYSSPFLEHLAWAAHDLIEEEGELDPVIEGYEAFRDLFEDFRLKYKEYRDIAYESKMRMTSLGAQDDFPEQLNFVLTKSENLYDSGKVKLDRFFEDLENDVEELTADDLIEGIKDWMQCNNNVCIALELMAGRAEGQRQLIQGVKAYLDAEGISLEEETVEVPSDTTDVG